MRQLFCSSAINPDNNIVRINMSQKGVHYSLKQMLSTLQKKNRKIILLLVYLFFIPALHPLVAGKIIDFVTNTGISPTVSKEFSDAGSYSGHFSVLPPVAVCKNITIQLGAGGNVTINASDIDGGSYDPDGTIANIVASPASFNCSNIGPNNVTLTITDNTGMISTCVAVVTVRDNLPPVMECKSLIVYLDQSGSATITPADLNNGTADNCAGPVRLYINRTVFSCSDIGAPVNVTLTGTDASGNTASCVSQITVRDTISPVISLKTFELVLDTDGTGTLQPSDIDNGSSDNCGPVSLSVAPNSFSCGDHGIKTVVFTAVDSHGNSRSESFKISVRPWFEIESMSLNNCYLALPYGLYKANLTGADSLFSFYWDGLEDLYKPFLTFIPVPPYLIPSNTSTLQTPFFNNADLPDGTYNIRLIVKDSIGCADTSEMVIRKEGPLFNNITSVYSEACEGATAIYTVNSDSGAIYSWSIENGLLLTPDPDTNRVEVQWNLGVSQGVVKATVTKPNFAGDPCISNMIDTVTVHPVQLPVFDSPAFTACSDLEYTYTLAGTFKAHFWNVTGGNIISGGKQDDNFVKVIWGTNPSGRVSVSVQNNFNCSASVFVDVIIDNLSGAVTSLTNISCNGGSDGKVTVEATSGSGLAPYSYSLDGGPFVATGSFSGISLGNHIVTIRDANFCNYDVPFLITQPPVPLTASTTVENVKCFGAATGSINLLVNGGTPPYSYLWNNGATTEDLLNIAAGVYTVTITDASLCTTTASGTVIQPASALIGITAVTNVSCFGGASGAVNLTVTGGTAPYTYLWSNGATTEDLVNVVAGVYTVTITDASLCTTTATATVTQPAAALGASAAVTNIKCFGEAAGAVNLTVTGGTAPYTFLWSNGATTEDLVNVVAGVYTVTVTDANLCTTTATGTVTQPAASLSGTTAVINVGCFGEATGAVNLTVTGGTEPYTYLWSNGAMTEDLVNVAAGVFTVTITDANLCTTIATGTVTQPSAALSASASVTNVSCFGEASGAVNLTVTGGTAPYTYLWSNGATTEDLVNVVAGVYTVTITDASLCTTTATATVTQPAAALGASAAVTNIKCFGEAAGAVNLTVTGGTAPYTFLWSNGATTEDLVNVVAGVYTVTVSDANLCTTTATGTVTQPAAPLSGTTAVTNAGCFGEATGAVNLTVTGGTAPYTYLWSNGAMTQDLVNVAAGAYTVTVTDANLCTTLATATVTQPAAALSASATATNVKCFGEATGAVDLTVTGGTAPYTYLWSNGASTEDLVNVAAGVYTVTITDANLCTAIASGIITQPAEALAGAITVTDIKCYGDSDGAVNLTVTGGTAPYTYLWSNGATTEDLVNVVAGAYTVTVTDANLCTATVPATVSQPSELIAVAGSNGPVCAGMSLNLQGEPDGMASYSWTGPDGFTSSLQNPVVTNASTPAMAGLYILNVVDINGCTATANTNVIVNELPVITFTQTDILCGGTSTGAIDITVSGGTGPFVYLWTGPVADPATEDQINIPAGSYTVIVTDAGSCSSSLTAIEITELPPLSGTIISKTNVSVPGGNDGSVTIEGSGGTVPYLYSLDAGPMQASGSFSALAAGTYTVTVYDANLCEHPVVVLITQPGMPLSGQIISRTDVLCYGDATGSVTVTGTAGEEPYEYSIDGGAFQSSGIFGSLTAGPHIVRIQDAALNTFDINVLIAGPSLPLNVTITQTDNICSGGNTGSATAIAAGGTEPYTYSWNTTPVQTGPDATGLAAGTYTVTVTDANGCIATADVTIAEPDPLSVTIIKNDVLCNGDENGSATVNVQGGTGPYLYSWDTTPVQTTSTINDLAPGAYSVTITDANGCTITVTVNIIEPAALTVTATVADALCPDTNEGEIELNIGGGIQPYTITWSDPGGFATQKRTDLYPGTYSVVVSDAKGCRASTSVEVGYAGSFDCLIIPDVITPNGDGHNDEWIIRNIDIYPEAEVLIYSRWGRLVYRTKNISENPWNGQYRGSEDLMPTDSYHYILHLNDGSRPRSGVISVIR